MRCTEVAQRVLRRDARALGRRQLPASRAGGHPRAPAPTKTRPARTVTLTAEPRPSNWLLRAILLLQQAAGVAVVLGAAWLVWIRPGPMTWGFFAYVIYFNPGQAFVF